MILFLLGALLVGLVFYDFLRTTISLSGPGFLSRAIADLLWTVGSGVVLRAERRVGLSLRGLIGPSILCAIAGAWILLHLLGYTLMYLSGASLAEGQSGDAATTLQTFAFAGSALSTLGASTVKVTGGWWDVLSMVAAVNGMIVLTLSVSFLLNVLQTTMKARTFATRFHALTSGDDARTDAEILTRAASLGPDLCAVAVQLTASPLPGVFVPSEPSMDFPAAISEICDRLDARDLSSRPGVSTGRDDAELRWGIGVLGRQFGRAGGDSDIEAARKWARRHTLPRS